MTCFYAVFSRLKLSTPLLLHELFQPFFFSKVTFISCYMYMISMRPFQNKLDIPGGPKETKFDDLGVIIMMKRCSIQQGEKGWLLIRAKSCKNRLYRLFRFFRATWYNSFIRATVLWHFVEWHVVFLQTQREIHLPLYIWKGKCYNASQYHFVRKCFHHLTKQCEKCFISVIN